MNCEGLHLSPAVDTFHSNSCAPNKEYRIELANYSVMRSALLLMLCRAAAIYIAGKGGTCTPAHGAGGGMGARRRPVCHSLPGRKREVVDHDPVRCNYFLPLAPAGPAAIRLLRLRLLIALPELDVDLAANIAAQHCQSCAAVCRGFPEALRDAVAAGGRDQHRICASQRHCVRRLRHLAPGRRHRRRRGAALAGRGDGRRDGGPAARGCQLRVAGVAL